MQEPHGLACSEVWGGNDEVERAVSMPGLDAFVLSSPHAGQAAGGDVHYLSSCATGRIGRVLIADVAGHGAQVAGLAVALRSILRRNVNHVDQARVMSDMNREFARYQREGEGGRSAGGLARFATAIVATFWGPSGDLDLTIAGHPPPLLYRAATRAWDAIADVERADEADVPLGILDMATYTRQQVRLRRGDVMMLYTDALVEARHRETGQQIGPRGLLRLVRECDPGDVPSLARTVMHRIREVADVEDDATIMVLRLNDIPLVEGGFLNGIATTWRLARDWARSVATGREFAWPQARIDNLLGPFFDRFNHRETHRPK